MVSNKTKALRMQLYWNLKSQKDILSGKYFFRTKQNKNKTGLKKDHCFVKKKITLGQKKM